MMMKHREGALRRHSPLASSSGLGLLVLVATSFFVLLLMGANLNCSPVVLVLAVPVGKAAGREYAGRNGDDNHDGGYTRSRPTRRRAQRRQQLHGPASGPAVPRSDLVAEEGHHHQPRRSRRRVRVRRRARERQRTTMRQQEVQGPRRNQSRRKGPGVSEERRDARDLGTFGSSSDSAKKTADDDDPPPRAATVAAVSEARIVGGEEIEEFRYPYLAALFKRFSPTYLEHRCGGVLVAPNVILSAAHCHDRADVAKLGEHRFDDNVTAMEEFNITQKFRHPDFDEFLLDYDIGLYVLDGKSAFAPVKMNFDNLTPTDGATLHVLGWGFTRWGGKASPVPNEVGVSYQPNELCNTRYVNSFDPSEPRITDAMMCAANPGKDACQGDSGGPLLRKGDPAYMASRRYAVNATATTTEETTPPAAHGSNGTTTTTEDVGENNEEDMVVGLVSWGFGCADAKYPGVYARVSSVRGWIMETLCTLGHEVHCDAAAVGGIDGSTTDGGPDPPPPAEAERAPRSSAHLGP